MTSAKKTSLIRFSLLVLAFSVILGVIFHTHITDDTTLMLNSDQLNGLGSRFLRVENLVMTQWDDSRLGGVPTLDALFGDAYHPLVLTQFIMDPARAVGFKFILCVWIAFISAFLLFRKLASHWQWAAFLALLYALNPQFFTHIYGGHDGKMMIFAIAPLTLLGIIQIVRDGKWSGIVITSLSVLWMLLSSHLQLTYLFLWGAGLFTLFEIWRLPATPKVKGTRLGWAGVALALALGMGAFQIIPPYLYTTQQSVRGTDEKTSLGHAASWSLHAEEMAAMLLPDFLQTDVEGSRQYWGHNHFKLNHDTAGIALTFLALLGLLVRNNRRSALFWMLGCTLALSYALGANSALFKLWYAILPGVKSFRAPSMAVFWLPLAMGVMAAPAFAELRKAENRGAIKAGTLWFVGLALVLTIARFKWDEFMGVPGAIAALVAGLTLAGILNSQDRQVELNLTQIIAGIKNGFAGSSKGEMVAVLLPFVFVAQVFLWGTQIASNPGVSGYFKNLDTALMASSAGKVVLSLVILTIISLATSILLIQNRSVNSVVGALVVLAAVDLFMVNSVYVQSVPRQNYIAPQSGVIKAIQQDSPDALTRPRVMSLTNQPALSGNIFPAYHSRNALGFHDNELASYREFRGGQNNSNFFKDNNFHNNPFINLLDIGYLIYDGPQGVAPMRNSGAMGPATVFNYWDTASAASAIQQLRQDFPYRQVALVETLPSGYLPQTLPDSAATSGSTAKLVASPKMDEQVYQVHSNGPGIMVVAGNYHPYWKATVNGQSQKVVKAFGTLRAVAVPAGVSEVKMQYRSDVLHQSFVISALSGGLFVLLVLVLIGHQVMRRLQPRRE